MTSEQFFAMFFSGIPAFILKLSVLILLFLHLAFAFVILRQTKIMLKVLEAQSSFLIYLISFLHFMFSFVIFIWAIIFL